MAIEIVSNSRLYFWASTEKATTLTRHLLFIVLEVIGEAITSSVALKTCCPAFLALMQALSLWPRVPRRSPIIIAGQEGVYLVFALGVKVRQQRATQDVVTFDRSMQAYYQLLVRR